jgi:DNA-binding winged helix-turn-helix (wHTH) protein/tetratricopeptide (TPR) repeat protein
MSDPVLPPLFRFGSFDFNLRSRELRKNGVKVDVQDQPLRLLATLIERPGELITREELHRRLWPADTFVDFEHGLNATVRRLRAALGCSAAAPFIETLPRRGYRLVVPVERPTADIGQVVSTNLTRLMLLPFRVLRTDAETDFLAFAIPDAVAAAMVGLRGVVIRSPIVGARYTGEVLDLARIAREAEVDSILTGTIARAGSRLRVNSQLLEVPAGTMIWSDFSEVAFEDLFHLQDTIVGRVVQSLSASLTPHERMVLKADVPSNPAMYELYLRANQLLAAGVMGGEQLLVARDLYQRALEQDPNYAPAWARLGRCHWLVGKGSERASEHLAHADEAFTRALAINPNLLMAHSYHAQVEADLGRALPAMVRLLALAQSSPPTPELFVALVQVCRFCGQLEASIAASERARGLDPHISTSANHTYWHLGDLDRAYAACTPGNFGLDAMILARWGRREEAIALQRKREAILPPTSRTVAAAHRAAIADDKAECIRVSTEAIAMWPDPEGRYYLATNLARFGESDRALAEMNRCLDDGFIFYRVIKRDPAVDTLRSLPAFRTLTDRAAAKYRDACLAFADVGGQRLFGL